MKLQVRALDGTTMIIEGLEPSDSIGNLKTKIQEKYKIPCTHQKLIVDDEECDDTLLLSDCELTDGGTVHFIRRTVYVVQVTAIGKNVHLVMDRDSTVRDMRKQIAEETKIKMEEQQLVWKGSQQIQEMDSKSLEELGFSLDDTNLVVLTTKTRGGHCLGSL